MTLAKWLWPKIKRHPEITVVVMTLLILTGIYLYPPCTWRFGQHGHRWVGDLPGGAAWPWFMSSPREFAPSVAKGRFIGECVGVVLAGGVVIGVFLHPWKRLSRNRKEISKK